MKRCCRCKQEKPLSDYCKDRQRSDGLAQRCKACRAELYRLQREKDPEGYRARQRQSTRKYVAANPDKAAAWAKAWRANNPDYSAEANRKWREANPGAASEYYRANPEKTMERVLRRRKKIAETRDAPIDFGALWETQGESCGICGSSIDRSLRHPDPMSPSIDHIVPLSKGGRHSQDNLQWAHLRCNLSKGARAA